MPRPPDRVPPRSDVLPAATPVLPAPEATRPIGTGDVVATQPPQLGPWRGAPKALFTTAAALLKQAAPQPVASAPQSAETAAKPFGPGTLDARGPGVGPVAGRLDAARGAVPAPEQTRPAGTGDVVARQPAPLGPWRGNQRPLFGRGSGSPAEGSPGAGSPAVESPAGESQTGESQAARPTMPVATPAVPYHRRVAEARTLAAESKDATPAKQALAKPALAKPKRSLFGSLALWKDAPGLLFRAPGAPAAVAGSEAATIATRPDRAIDTRPDRAIATRPDRATAPTLLTGATGFVGSAVARALAADGHTLRLLVRPGADRRNIDGLEAEIAAGDLTDAPSLTAALAGCRYLVHVAADYRLWVPDPKTMQATNVDGTRALLLAAKAAGVERIVYCSSVAALGLEGDGTPGTEETPVEREAIVGAYKQSKYDAEQLVRSMAAEGLPVVIVAPSAPVGPRDRRPTPTGKMVLDAAAGRMPAYVETGLNIVHVDDVARGHVLALHHGEVGQTYILGGEDLGMAHLLAIIDDVMGRPPQHRTKLSTGVLAPVAMGSELKARMFGSEPLVTREMLAMADKQMFYSSAKATEALGYTARPARQAVADAIAWFRQAGMLPG